MTPVPSPQPAIPTNSLIFGYGPMLPFVLGAVGSWVGGPMLRGAAVGLTIIWGSLIMAFVGGVRRGFGFGDRRASLTHELWTMAAYVTAGGGAAILGWLGFEPEAVGLLAAGFAMVAVADTMAARAGDAPAHFAALRPPQMAIAALSLLAILARLLAG